MTPLNGFNMTRTRDFNFGLENNSNPEDFNFFQPPLQNQKIIPEVDYESPTLGYAARQIETETVIPNRAGADNIVDEGHLKNEMGLRASIKSSLENTEDGIDMGSKVEAAEIALQEGMPAPSVGSRFKQENFPTADKDVANAIDRKLIREDAEANILTNLGFNTSDTKINDFLDKRDPELSEVLIDAFKNYTPLGLSLEAFSSAQEDVKEELKELREFLPEDSATVDLIDFLNNEGENAGGVSLALNAAGGILTDRLGEAVREDVFPTIGLRKDANIRDIMEYLSFLPTDPDAEIDIENAVSIVFSKGTLNERMAALKEWDEEFVGKYGDGAYYQLAAFMAKEGIVDAAALAVALKNKKIAKTLIADNKDKIYKKMAKALGRASVMGVGGTGVQASMDQYLGFETDTTDELGLRIGGAFVGEGVAKALASTGRGILGAGNKLINQGEKLFGANGSRAAASQPETLFQSMQGIQPEGVNLNLVDNLADDFDIRPEDLITQDLATTITNVTPGNSTQPYRQLAKDAIEEFRAGRQGNLGHIFDVDEAELTKGLYTGKTVKDEIMLGGVGNRIIGETVAKQTEVDNILKYYFEDGLKTVAHRQGALKGDESVLRWKSLFSDPRNWVGDVADDVFDELLVKDVYQKALVEAQEAAFKGLDTKATNKILDVRAEFEEMATKYPGFKVTQAHLDMKGLSPKEQDAYWATGKLLDFSAILSENIMVSSAQKKGLKQIGDRLFTVVRTRDDGISVVKELGINKPELEIATGDLQDVTRVMGYKRNFVPRRADRPDFMIGIMDTKTGKIDVPYASRYRGEVQEKLSQLDAELADSNKVAFYWQSLTDEKSLNFGMSNNSMSLIDNLDESTILKLREALADNADTVLKDVDMDNLRLAFDNITYGSIASQKIAGKRSKEGLKKVTGEAFDYKPSDEAITQHLMESSALKFQDYRSDIIKQFEKQFAEVLDPTQNWNQPIKNIEGKADLVQRAKSVQGFISNNVFNETQFGKEFKNGIVSWSDRMRKSGGKSKQRINAIEKMPIVENLFKQTRDGTAFFRATSSAMVFAGNVGSFITQVAPSAAMIVGAKGITNPNHLARGWTDMMSAFTIRAGMPEKFASKNARASLRALERSGILAKAEISDLANAAYGQSSTLFNKAMFFVSQGEKVNRANIWFTIRAEMMSKAAKGTLNSIDGERVLTKADIDSDEFLQLVSTKAKQLFLDTTQAGKLRALSGVGSVIGQFTAPVIKTHTMWFAKGLSRGERIGASLGLFSFYGINAIPFVAAGMYTADKAAQVFAGSDEIDDASIISDIADNFARASLDKVQDLTGFSDEQKQFFIDTVKKGGVSTLTGGEVDLYHKMSIGLFINESVDSIEDPLAAVPVISILGKAGESASNIAEMLYQVYEAHTNPESEDQKVRDMRTFMGTLLNETGNALPGFGKIVDTLNNHPDTRRYLNPELENLDDKGWVTRGGKRVETDKQFDSTDRMLNLFGITPAPVQENRELLSKQFDRVKILKDMKESWRDKYKTAGTDTARTKVIRDALQEAAEAEAVLMATYQGALSIAVGSSDDKAYRRGSLQRQWKNMFKRLQQERISGNRTRSRGE